MNNDRPDDNAPRTVTNQALNIMGIEIDGVVSFKGIPYAEPPVGELRFAPPVSKTQWDETLDCTRFGSCAIQSGTNAVTDEVGPSEDCLFLNVWAPANAKQGDGLPVYVWIHGGAFYQGAGSIANFDGSAFAKDGIVTVTINYRLGALGFLALDTLRKEHGTTGNWGTLDQIMALQWVHDHISEFGGDPENVTVGRESAGSVSVSNLVLSDRAAGLFRRAIMERALVEMGWTFAYLQSSIPSHWWSGCHPDRSAYSRKDPRPDPSMFLAAF